MTAQSLPATSAEAKLATPLARFLSAFVVDSNKLHTLTRELEVTFRQLVAESQNQFLPTPISSTLLSPIGIWQSTYETHPPRAEVHLERSCPIGEQLKHKNPSALFDWVGQTIAAVVKDGCSEFDLDPCQPLPMGVTFSFPMLQRSLAEAVPMSMGKGFKLEDGIDLGSQLLQGYEKYRGELPPVTISAIANDSVSTLISFIYQYGTSEEQSAAMGLIVGTGSNATVTLPATTLGEKVKEVHINSGTDINSPDTKITVNTEWSINGTAGPLRELGLITMWDDELDRDCDAPGFQPLEYLTAGRYLGELGRIVFLHYLTAEQGIAPDLVPAALHNRYSMSTTFLSYFGPSSPRFLEKLESTFPSATEGSQFVWDESHVEILYEIAQAIELRAASIMAAATIALLRVSGEIPAAPDTQSSSAGRKKVLGVGYTGGCIVNFQNYLYDYEKLIEQIIVGEFGAAAPVRVELMACHHGGITGAGILAAAVLANQRDGC
ncbi:related to hexokinase [Cephalotrichum gorgonifer]|uniref:Phosphotransferase n=1 Tax=Cephalotrichum gorgonifer TaxID=2041049 RepID=A0AAE8STJ8_9PEZI|nr:related to hexokinase [Cephalotrichum gorgonifer]